MRIIIAGSRSITEYSILIEAIDAAIKNGIIIPSHSFEIISGDAKGVDSLAKKYATESSYKFTEIRPEYKTRNDRAAPNKAQLQKMLRIFLSLRMAKPFFSLCPVEGA